MAAGEVVKRETFWGIYNRKTKQWSMSGGLRKRWRDEYRNCAQGYLINIDEYVRPFTVVTHKKVKESLTMVASSVGGQVYGLLGNHTLHTWLLQHDGAELIVKLTVKKK